MDTLIPDSVGTPSAEQMMVRMLFICDDLISLMLNELDHTTDTTGTLQEFILDRGSCALEEAPRRPLSMCA